jgi:site-specific DNA recombinase
VETIRANGTVRSTARRVRLRASPAPRVSTTRQAQAQTIEQQLDRLREAVAGRGWALGEQHVYRDDGFRLRAGTLLPWTRPPFGYRLDAERPRDAAAVRVEPGEAVLVAQMFDWYLEPRATVHQLARRLTDLGVATPTGKPRWNVASVRGILRNPAYAGRALTAAPR